MALQSFLATHAGDRFLSHLLAENRRAVGGAWDKCRRGSEGPRALNLTRLSLLGDLVSEWTRNSSRTRALNCWTERLCREADQAVRVER
jgi:hypothetical protein